jgi:type I restriction enzyme S subunit
LDEATIHRRTLQAGDIIFETAGGNRDRPTGRTLFVREKLLHELSYP